MAVTFLPGNFAAALFSTSLFGSETAANVITIANKSLFALFWFITIPLTLFIYIVVIDQLTNRSQARRTS
ncbi:hypothetical protein V2G26_014409 [Clonostachys chloroleuca]